MMPNERTTSVNSSYDRVAEFLSRIDRSEILGTPIVIGSISRIVESALPNWGILVGSSDTNALLALRQVSNSSYLTEWAGRGDGNPPSRWNQIIIEATKESGLVGVYEGLNATVAEFVRAVIKTLESFPTNSSRDYVILDIGCGVGATSIATMQALSRAGLTEKVRLIINDVSRESRQAGENSLAPYFPERGYKLTTLAGQEEMALPTLPEESVDIVITNAVLHHFTNSNYLRRIKRILRPGGFIISGDYHTTIWHHPILMEKFLEELGASRDVLSAFRTFFGINSESFSNFTRSQKNIELQANAQMVNFWTKLSFFIARERFRPSPVFEAHESSAQRLARFAAAGFETDPVQMMAGFYPERAEDAIKAVRETEAYKGLTEDDQKKRLEKRAVLDILREFPVSEMSRIASKIQPGSDIARVIVARKPLVAR